MIGSSPAFEEALKTIDLLAPSLLPIVLRGDPGTGKEGAARRAHDNSSRSAGPFIVIDCAKIPRDLVESTLFGHERGAFTGATGKRIGLFELAHGGTAFLDEVAELPLEQQPKLLRVLQEGTILPVGASKSRQIDVRVVAATNQDLAEMMRLGKFREDLYWRLVGHCILLPSLQDRGDDVVEIAEKLLQRILPRKVLTKAARELLRTYGWPGNIRQLENVIEGSVALSPERWIDHDVVWHQIQVIENFGVVKEPEPSPRKVGSASQYDAAFIFIKELGPATAAAIRAVLGMSKTTCHRLLKRLEADGHIRRTGEGSDTQYVAVDHVDPPSLVSARADMTVHRLTSHQREILRLLGMASPMSLREIRAQVSMTTVRMLRRDLQRLRLEGLVQLRGHGQTARWSLVGRP